MIKSLCWTLSAAGMVSLASSAIAGEITGNGKDKTVKGHSLCAYSGINDTPEGDWIEVAPGFFIQIDPGGRTQSYGSFYAHYDWFPSPSDPDARSSFLFPGTGCNPNKSGGGH